MTLLGGVEGGDVDRNRRGGGFQKEKWYSLGEKGMANIIVHRMGHIGENENTRGIRRSQRAKLRIRIGHAGEERMREGEMRERPSCRRLAYKARCDQ